MTAIIDTLFNSVFPVALIFVIGFYTGKRHIFGNAEAQSLFAFIARISAPAIIVNIIITTDIANLDLRLAGLYLISELIIYAASFLLSRLLFGLDFKNALLCGLAAAFANHVLFVYPITQFAFAPEMSLPVRSIITIDILVFIVSVIILDIHSNPSKGLGKAIAGQISNPLFIALALGVLIYVNPFGTPVALVRSASFIADTAAPCGLFASGVLLSQGFSAKSLKLAGLITGLKMLLHPLLGFVIIIYLGGYTIDVARTTLMVTAAPVGIMALTFASRYNGETQAIAQAILWSFCLSVLFIPILATI